MILVILLFGVVSGSLLKNVPKREMFDVTIDRNHPEKVLKDFEDFIIKYQRNYTSAAEKSRRLGHFARKHNRLQKLRQNASLAGTNVTFGLNHFADWTREEFEGMLSHVPPPSENEKLPDYSKIHNSTNIRSKRSSIPENYDLREATINDAPLIGRIKNQGSCGCCWAFAVTALTETVYTLKNYKHRSLSDQEICDCGISGKTPGCVGGDPHYGLRYASQLGQTAQSVYPYVDGRANKTGQCRLKKTKRYLDEYDFKTKSINKRGAEKKIMEHLVDHNIPVAVYFRVGEDFENYESGILESQGCDKTKAPIWHSGAIVGFGTSYRSSGRTVKYWILRNSWDDDWGEKGYIRVVRGIDWCDIEKDAVTAVLNKKSSRYDYD